MYDDLIVRLHSYTENCVAYKLDADFAAAIQQAADAIEELQTKLKATENSGRLLAAAFDRLKAQMPRWISVEERPPEAYEDILLLFPNNQAAGFCDRDGCWCVYSGDGFYTEVAENEPKPTHWANKLPSPPKEE